MTVPIGDERDSLQVPPYVVVESNKVLNGKLNIPTDLSTHCNYIPDYNLDSNCILHEGPNDDYIDDTLVRILGVIYLPINGKQIRFKVVESPDAILCCLGQGIFGLEGLLEAEIIPNPILI